MSEWKESAIGLITAKWDISTVDAIKSSTKHSISMGPFGSNITKDNFIDDGVPVIRGNNLTDFIFNDNDFVFVSDQKAEQLKASQCKRKDIIITHRGTLGQVGYIPEDSKFDKYIVSQSGMKLTVDEEIVDSKFVFYFLKSPIGQYLLLMNASQTGVPAIAQPTTSLKAIPIPIPSEHEVAEIVKTLDSIQNKINLLHRQNETLEAIAQTLFKRWFVEFEFPNKEGQPYKSSGGKMASSKLGEIPAGWRVGKIKDFGNVVCGKTPSKAIIEYFNGDVPFIKIPDMHGTVFVIDTEDTLSEKGANSQQTKFLPAYSINVSCIATVGLVTINSKASHTNQQINSIIPINEFYLEYLFFSLKSLSNYLKSLGSGGSDTFNVNTNTFSNIDLLIPKETAIKNYHNQISAVFKKIELNAYSIINLHKTRGSLLPKLMSGQIRVKEN
jgi:type I restriction enzyme S subunit